MNKKSYLRYVYAILAVPLVVLLRFALRPLTGPGIPFITLFPVTVAVALLAGFGPSLLTGILGAIVADYFFIGQPYSIEINVAFLARTTVMILTSVFVGYVGDMLRAARTKAEQQALALRDSQMDFNRAQTVGNIGSWRLDTRRNELTWSDENHRMFGIPKGTPMTYETFLATVHPDDREYVDTKWKAGLAGEPYDIEHRIVVENQIKWVREKAYLEFDDNGALLGAFGITQDITERKRMENELRQAHDELEIRVKERTTELDEAVAELQKQVEHRIEAEEALRSSALYMRGLLEASLDPVVMISEDGKITDVNNATEAATGLSRESLINTDFSDYFIKPENARQSYKKVLSKGQVKDYPLTIRHITGRTTDVLYNATVYKNETGEIQGVFAAARDVTEHNKADARTRITNALLELFAQKNSRKEYLDSVVKAIHDWSSCECVGIRLTDNDGFIPFESYVGYSKEFLALENKLCLKTDACACIRAISQTPEPQDEALLTPKGSFRSNNSLEFIKSLPEKVRKRYRGNCMRFGFASLAVIPIRYRDKILGAIHLADKKENKMPTEIVEFLENMAMLIGEAVHRFDIETEMRESEQRYRQLVELSPDGIGLERDDKIVFINTEGANLLGYKKPEEVIGKLILDFVHPDYKSRTHRQLEYLRRKQKALPLREEKFLRVDGTLLDVEVAATPLIYQNKPAALIVFRDITERKLAQERIVADQKQLRQLTAELVLAEERERHAIATAMHDSIGPILAFTKRELGILRKTAPSKIAESLESIGINISEVVTQTRTLTFDLSPPTLYTLGFEIAVGELTERFCKEHKLEHSFNNSDEPKPLADHVKVLLYRSIRELLINIAKHANAGLVKVTISRDNNDIKVIVEDDGKGYDVAATNERAIKRKGLGLFSVRERLTHIGGKFEIESKRGKGTRATLTAPLKLD
ncbi:MAG: PAS domain S-box protein [Planctomycetota bacterium]